MGDAGAQARQDKAPLQIAADRAHIVVVVGVVGVFIRGADPVVGL